MSGVYCGMNKALAIDISARPINEAHRMALESAETAVDYAIRCGQLLAKKKKNVPRGEWVSWVNNNYEFSWASAKIYMKAATQKARGLAFSSLNQLYGKTNGQLLVQSNSNQWFTPSDYVKAGRSVLGRIDLDPPWRCRGKTNAVRGVFSLTEAEEQTSP